MILQTVDLFGYFKAERKGETAGTLRCYCHGQLTEMGQILRRPAVLVLPGGGYGSVSEREAEPVAMEYYTAGYDAFVLYYDIAPLCYPAQIREAAMAMMYIRKNADALDILPGKVAAVGFSAGGHLLGCISALWDDAAVIELFGDSCVLVRPDASVYSYPVVSSDPSIYHGGSFRNFCGTRVNADDYSIDRKIRSECSPAFIWANTPDGSVPVQNSLRLYSAYHAAGVPVELHIFRDGWHGMSVCTEETERVVPVQADALAAREWVGLSKTFLKTLGFTPVK